MRLKHISTKTYHRAQIKCITDSSIECHGGCFEKLTKDGRVYCSLKGGCHKPKPPKVNQYVITEIIHKIEV